MTDANMIGKLDFLDLLFYNRNKKYGAYALRRTYRKRLWMALMITIFAGGLAVLFLQPAAAEWDRTLVNVREVVLENIETPKPAPPPPPEVKLPEPAKVEAAAPARPAVVRPKVKTTKFTPPVIKKDKDVKKTEMPPVKEIATVAAVSTEGVKVSDKDLRTLPPVKAASALDVGTGVIQAPPKKKVDENKIFEKVEIAASVNGAQWRQHLQQYLQRYIEDAANNGMEPGTYTVNVRFLVEKNGTISQVKALNNPGYGLARGAEQVVKTGPKWQPGEQNGRKVRSFHTQPITFVVMDF